MTANGNKDRVTSVRLPEVYTRWLNRYGTPIGIQMREDLAVLMLLSNPMLTELNDYFTVSEACFITEALSTSDYLSLVSDGSTGGLVPLHEIVYWELGKATETGLHKRWRVDLVNFQGKIDEVGFGPLHAYQLFHMARMAAQHIDKDRKEFKVEVARIFQTRE